MLGGAESLPWLCGLGLGLKLFFMVTTKLRWKFSKNTGKALDVLMFPPFRLLSAGGDATSLFLHNVA